MGCSVDRRKFIEEEKEKVKAATTSHKSQYANRKMGSRARLWDIGR
jgi:hypothetical protein